MLDIFHTLINLIAFFPMILIPFVIILKIMMGNKFETRGFYALLIILLALSGITLTIIFYMGQPFDNGFYIPFIHRINEPLGIILTLYFSLLNIYLLIFWGILFVYCIIKYIQIKDINLLKRLGASSLIIISLIILALPTLYFPIYSAYQYDPYYPWDISKKEIEKMKLATKLSVIPAMKAFYSDTTALLIDRYLFNEYQEKLIIPDFSSQEAQSLIDEYIKYQEYSAKTKNYSEYALIAVKCLNYERHDQALTYTQIAQNYGFDAKYLTSAIYIAKGEYQKALEYINPEDNFFATKRKLVAIYIGLEKFDKAEDIINEIKEDKIAANFILEAKIYLNYKKGNTKLAKELFENYKQKHRKFQKYSFEEFIKYLDRINF